MNKVDEAIQTIEGMDSSEDSLFGRVHPLPKLLVTFLFLILLTSIQKYRLDQVLYMALFLWIYQLAGSLSLRDCFRKLKVLFGMLLLIGLANPFFDRTIAITLGRVPISYGVISMLVLYGKAVLAVCFSYFLVVTTGMEGICSALASLHLPGVMITVFMLIYRYISVLLGEASRLFMAYTLRAPGQKGVHVSAWGSFIGSLLLRSMDRAKTVYESMELRGFSDQSWFVEKRRMDRNSLLYLAAAVAVMVLFRFVPVFSMIGNLVIG